MGVAVGPRTRDVAGTRRVIVLYSSGFRGCRPIWTNRILWNDLSLPVALVCGPGTILRFLPLVSGNEREHESTALLQVHESPGCRP